MNRNLDLNATGYVGAASSGEPAGTRSKLTRRVYDFVAPVYSVSTRLFHSRAHQHALAASGIQNGMRVLEVAMGSGEMFQRLVRSNPDGQTIGVDISPNMAARTQAGARRTAPRANAHCQAADARSLPFATDYFDAIMCCYLFELLPEDDAVDTLVEFQRVLRPGGKLGLILVRQDASLFASAYKFCARMVPAFWGHQVEKHLANALSFSGFVIHSDENVRQIFFQSRVISASKLN